MSGIVHATAHQHWSRSAVRLSVALCVGMTSMAASAMQTPGAGPDVPPASVRLDAGGWDDVQRRVARHRGQVVVVAVWTTTCPICLDEFPAFLRLQETFGRERVALVGVNCDYDGIKGKPPAFYRPRVLKFLRQQKAGIENVLLNVALIDFLERIDLGSTPAFLVYGPDGTLARRFDNDDATAADEEFSMADVARCVAGLLGS